MALGLTESPTAYAHAGRCFSYVSREPLIQTASHSTWHFLEYSAIRPPSVKSIGRMNSRRENQRTHKQTEIPSILDREVQHCYRF